MAVTAFVASRALWLVHSTARMAVLYPLWIGGKYGQILPIFGLWRSSIWTGPAQEERLDFDHFSTRSLRAHRELEVDGSEIYASVNAFLGPDRCIFFGCTLDQDLGSFEEGKFQVPVASSAESIPELGSNRPSANTICRQGREV